MSQVNLGLYVHDRTQRVYDVRANDVKVKVAGEWMEDGILYRDINNPELQYVRAEEDFLNSFTMVAK